MRFTVLGPVTVDGGDGPVTVAAGLPRRILTMLLLHANKVVATGELAEAVWGADPPATAAESLRNHVVRLRRLLGPQAAARIERVAPGYAVSVQDGELDAHEFAHGCGGGLLALQQGDWTEAARALSAALALWQGEPYPDLPLDHAHAEAQRLGELRLAALEGRVEAELRLGHHKDVIAEIRALTRSHPLHEGFHAQLMLSLYRAGRQAEALEAFHQVRRTLVDELGVEPSLALRELHTRVLAADPLLLDALDGAVRAEAGGARVPVPAAHRPDGSRPRAPNQLPADSRLFTGRETELKELIALADEVSTHDAESGATVVISAIDGMAGIGKSALAVHAAQAVREGFPGGQYFLDLHGHTAGFEPLTAAQALDSLLRSIGVAPEAIPPGLDERAALYRDRLHGTRSLIVLDNALSSAQVRLLVPGSAGCMVLITSRRRLTGLEDAHTLALDLMPGDDAIRLLHRIAGHGRVPRDHAAIGELIELCGHLPLAIRITAARLRHHRLLRIEDVVGQLRGPSGDRLAYLADESRSIEAVFGSSYAALSPDEQRMFRHLGMVPCHDVDAHAAAALVGTDLSTADRLLESLLDHSLLLQHAAGRYRFHDLVSEYARALGKQEAEGTIEAARDRLLRYYAYCAQTADRHLIALPRPTSSPALPAPGPTPRLTDWHTALAWMRAERENVLAAIGYAAVRQPALAVSLTASVAAFLRHEADLELAGALHLAAADIARGLGDRLGEANALHELGQVRRRSGRHAEAQDLHERALAIYRGLGDRLGEAGALNGLGRVRHQQGEFAVAEELHERAVANYRALGDRLGEATALADLGSVRQMTKAGAAATADVLEQALSIYREIGHRFCEAGVLGTLADIGLSAGDRTAAAGSLETALAIFGDLGIRFGEANMSIRLAGVKSAAGDYAAAASLLEQAHATYHELGIRLNEAYALSDLGAVRIASGDSPGASELLRRALAIFEDLGNRLGQANALYYLSRISHLAGDFAAEDELLERTFVIVCDLGDRQGQAEVLNSKAALIARTAGPRPALDSYRRALSIAREIGSALDEAHALEGLARCLACTSEAPAAVPLLRDALAVYRRIGAPDTEAAASFLAELEQSGSAD